MVTNGGHDPTPSFLQIKKDDKFFSKLLSKEEEASFRLSYYNGVASAAIPFTWESQPGTPKHTLFSDNSIPPLTPPPSYLSPARNRAAVVHHKRSKSSFQGLLFPRSGSCSSKKSNVSPSASCSSSSSSMSSSYSTSPSSIARSRSTIGFGIDEDEEVEEEEEEEEEEKGQFKKCVRANSALCFGARFGGRRRFSGHRHSPVKNWRRVFLSITGRGTA